jgi:integrase
MTVEKVTPGRPRGTGSLSVRRDSAGRETWYGRYRAAGRLVRRRIDLKRQPGGSIGMTRKQAEVALRRLMDAEGWAVPTVERLTVSEAGERFVSHIEAQGRKRSTLQDYRSALRIHLAPFFAGRSLDSVTPRDVELFMASRRAAGKSPKSIRNWLSLLHSIFAHAEKRGWARGNPVKHVDKPRAPDTDADVRYLDEAELEALLRAVPDDPLGGVDRVLYLVAAMTGLRQGELLALRWRDVDWVAARVRVRRSFVRGEFGAPKSRRATRSVPLAERVAQELERHYQRSAFRADNDLVFGHPQLGSVLDRSKVLKRFKAALRAGEVREVRFHDLRHTFGTRMAGAGVAMRTLQEWMGHRDFKTTLIYADYAPSAHEADLIERAFRSEPEMRPRDALRREDV